MARAVTQGDTIDLYIEVRNIYGVLVNSSTPPAVSIYDFDSDPRSATTVPADALVLSDTTVTTVAQGIYLYQYVVGATAHVGTWYDEWVITIDGVSSAAVLQFTVQPSAANEGAGHASTLTGTTVLTNNSVIVITLGSAVAAITGETLGSDFQYYFTTAYAPLYSTVRKVRIRAGGHLTSVPDDTILLAIFEGSLAANSLTFPYKRPRTSVACGMLQASTGVPGAGNYLAYAQENYAICMSIMYLLGNSLGPAAKKKKLADFSVEYGDGGIADFMKELRDECQKWEDVLNTGGQITAGGSVDSTVAFRGLYDPDAKAHGRSPLPNSDSGSLQGRIPAANTKVRPCGRNRYYHTYVPISYKKYR